MEQKERQGWRDVILTEVTSKIGDGLHGTPSYDDEGEYFFLNGNNLIQGKIVIKPDTKRVSESEFIKHKKPLSDQTILISINGTIGNLALYKREKCILGKSACYINVNDIVIRSFLYYVFLDKDFQSYIKETATGTTIPNVPLKGIREFSFKLPPLPEQKAIAEVLSSLDDKIDLLHRQNKTLEDMAQALFHKWFVEDMDERWEKIELGKLVKCTTGHSYRSTELQPSNIALVTLKNFARDGSFRMDGYKEFVGKFKDSQIVRQGDLIVSHTDITQEADIIGNPALVVHPDKYDTLVITMDLMKVESDKKWLSKEFLFYLFKSRQFKSHCVGCSNGTTVLHMNRKAIPSYKFKIPNKEKVIIFANIVKPNIDKVFSNISNIKTLENLRENLLSKLMGGNVRVILNQA